MADSSSLVDASYRALGDSGAEEPNSRPRRVSGSWVSAMESENGDAQSDVQHAEAHRRQNTRRRVHYGLGALCLLVVVGVAAWAGAGRPSFSNSSSSQADRDNAATDQLASQITVSQDGTVQLTPSQLGANASTTLQNALGSNQLSLTAAKMQMDTNSVDGRKSVVVTGTSSCLTHTACPVMVRMHYLNNSLQMLVEATAPEPVTLGQVVSNSDANDDAAVALASSDLTLDHASFRVANSPTRNAAGDHIPLGLSFTGVAYLSRRAKIASSSEPGVIDTNSSGTGTGLNTSAVQLVLDAFKEFGQQLKERYDYTEQTAVQVLGTLKPVLWINVTQHIGSDRDAGELTNLTVRIMPFQETASAWANLTIRPPGFEPFNAWLQGSISLKTKTITLDGNQEGSWGLPGHPNGFELSQAGCNLTIHYGNSTFRASPAGELPVLDGTVAAQVSYGQTTGALRFGFPWDTPGEGAAYAIAVTLSDSFTMKNLPALSGATGDFPDLTTIKAAFLFSNYSGMYTFDGALAAAAPVPSTAVVRGLTMVLVADVQSSPVLHDLPGVSMSPGAHLMFTGQIQEAGGFTLSAELDDVRLDSAVNMTKVLLQVGSSKTGGSYFSIAAQLSVSASKLNAEGSTPLLFNVGGSVNKSYIEVDGNEMVNMTWKIKAGAANVTVVHPAVYLLVQRTADASTGALQVSNVEGQLTGDVVIGRYTASFSARFDDVVLHQNESCVYLNLDVHRDAAADQGTASDLAAVVVPAHASQAFDAPSSIMDAMLHSSMMNVDLGLNLPSNPTCGGFNAFASVSDSMFGAAVLGFTTHQFMNESGLPDWRFSVFVQPVPTWDFAKSSVAPQGMNDVKLTKATLVLSSRPDTVNFNVSVDGVDVLTSFSTVQGLNLRCVMGVSHASDGRMSLVNHLLGNETELVFFGTLSSTAWSLSLQLTGGMPGLAGVIDLGHGVQLRNSRMSLSGGIGQSSDQFDFKILASVLVPSRFAHGDIVEFDVTGNLDDYSASLSGDCHDANSSLAVSLGLTGVSIQNLSVSVGIQWGSANGSAPAMLTGTLYGSLYVGDGQSHFVTEMDLLKDYQLAFSATMSEHPPVTFGQLVTDICGHDALDSLPLPSSIKSKIGDSWAFQSLGVNASTSPESLNGSGTIDLFGKTALTTVVHMWHKGAVSGGSDGGPAWAFTFGVAMAPESSFSSVLPSVTTLDHYPMSNMAVAVAQTSDTVQFPHASYPVSHGFNFVANLQLAGSSNKALSTIAKWTHIDSVSVNAVIQSESSFTVNADAHSNISFWNRMFLTSGGIIIQVTPAYAAVGLEADVVIVLSHRPQDHLPFHGDFMVADLGLKLDVAMTSDWVDPLGVRGVTIKQAALSFGISWEVVPYVVGIAGGLYIDGVGGQGAVYWSEDQLLLYGSLSNMSLSNIVNGLLGDVGIHPPHLLDVITDMSFQLISLYNNDGATVVFNGQTYPPGFKFSIQKLDLWEIIKGSASVQIADSGFDLNANLDPISLLDGLIVVSGATGAQTPVIMQMSVHADSLADSRLNASGAVALFGNRLACAAEFSDTVMKLYIDMSLLGDLFDFTLNCTSEGPSHIPLDFSVEAIINNRLQDYIAEEVPKQVHATSDKINGDLEAAEQDLTEKEAALHNVTNTINAIKATDTRHFSAAEQSLYDAQQKLNSAQAHVNELQNSINNYKNKIHDLHWYDKWKAVGYGVCIAGLEVAKVTADGVLDVAKDALKVAQDAVGVAPDFDPRVLALQTEYGVKEAAYVTAQEFLKGLQKVDAGVADLIDGIAHAQAEIFNIEQMSLEGSLKQMAQGDLANLHIEGIFLTKHVDVTIDITVTKIDNWISAIWKDIVDIFKHL